MTPNSHFLDLRTSLKRVHSLMTSKGKSDKIGHYLVQQVLDNGTKLDMVGYTYSVL